MSLYIDDRRGLFVCPVCGQHFGNNGAFTAHLSDKTRRHALIERGIHGNAGVYIRQIGEDTEVSYYIGQSAQMITRYPRIQLEEIFYFEEIEDAKIRSQRERELIQDFIEAGLPLANGFDVQFSVAWHRSQQ